MGYQEKKRDKMTKNDPAMIYNKLPILPTKKFIKKFHSNQKLWSKIFINNTVRITNNNVSSSMIRPGYLNKIENAFIHIKFG